MADLGITKPINPTTIRLTGKILEAVRRRAEEDEVSVAAVTCACIRKCLLGQEADLTRPIEPGSPPRDAA